MVPFAVTKQIYRGATSTCMVDLVLGQGMVGMTSSVQNGAPQDRRNLVLRYYRQLAKRVFADASAFICSNVEAHFRLLVRQWRRLQVSCDKLNAWCL